MNSVAIIGAGITGLTAGFYLQRKGVPVTVYEAAGRVGGVIRSLRRDGYLAEFGPNTLLETSPKIGELVRDAGLQSRRLDPDPKTEARYVVRYRRPIAMPGSPLGFFTTGLFTARAKLAVLREPFVPARRDGREESIAEFVQRRLGQEFLDHAIDALVAGVYAGDPYKLSVPHAFPKLAAIEAKYGSLIKGQILGARERKKRGEVAKDRAPKFSFDEGLEVLPETLGCSLGDALRLNCAVSGLTQTPEGWLVNITGQGRTEQARHSAVLFVGTAYRLAELALETDAGLSFSSFAGIRYPPVASVVLGFRREDVAHPCEGFGMLIPRVEGFKILGTIFSSSLFPNRAPSGHLTLTSYVGGERYPELASLPPEELFTLTCEDLRILLGVRGKPTFQHSVLYPQAIPQYVVGYGRYRHEMNEIEKKAAGLFLAGHYR
ncbi:MAG: protoporphyrinogen oxidase, partial [Bryobacteraceae bacterium]